MKTVLFVSQDRSNQVLYETVLGRRFNITFNPDERVDAIVVDLPTLHGAIDLRWISELEVPTVVLTPEDSLPLPVSQLRRVLTYPVSAARLLQTLAALGVSPEDKAQP